MTDTSEWFNTFEKVPIGKWPIMVVDNQKLWVGGVGAIKIQCVINGKWEKWSLS